MHKDHRAVQFRSCRCIIAWSWLESQRRAAGYWLALCCYFGFYLGLVGFKGGLCPVCSKHCRDGHRSSDRWTSLFTGEQWRLIYRAQPWLLDGKISATPWHRSARDLTNMSRWVFWSWSWRLLYRPSLSTSLWTYSTCTEFYTISRRKVVNCF